MKPTEMQIGMHLVFPNNKDKEGVVGKVIQIRENEIDVEQLYYIGKTNRVPLRTPPITLYYERRTAKWHKKAPVEFEPVSAE